MDRAIPILPSRSLPVTVRFYEALGFAGGVHRNDPNYAILTRGSVEIHFFTHVHLDPARSHAGCYLRVQDVDTFHADVRRARLPERGIPRMDRLEDKPWGMREFAIVDPDGNLLRIGQAATPPPS